ncbi:MAG: hypothetical protein GX781_07060 [Clostridiales bacterium]|nr:hypothetical protein [Clostridiales bacterium]
MIYEIVTQFPDPELFLQGDTYTSLYQPTHRYFPLNKQDPIVFKNLLKELEASLETVEEQELKDKLMAPFYALQEDIDFWNHTLDGIAMLASRDRCIIYPLHVQPDPLAVVAHSFHIKPLLAAFQSVEKFQLLVLSRESFSMYEGNQNEMTQLDLEEGAPRTMQDALGDQLTDGHLSYGFHGGAGNTPMYHGVGGTQSEMDKDTEKYFRAVDAYVIEHFSNHAHLPLVLVSLPEHQSLFYQVSKNPWLMEESIQASAHELDSSDVKKKAHLLIKHLQRKKIDALKESYQSANARQLATTDLVLAVKTATEGRVSTLLLQRKYVQGGTIDRETGKITQGDITKPYYDDVLDDLAQLVLSMGGEVMMLEAEDMPGDTGLAVIFRY